MSETKIQYKKPVSCFHKFTDYEKQFRYDMQVRTSVHIDNVDVKEIEVKSSPLYCNVDLNGKPLLYLKNLDELSAFAGAILDGISNLRDIDKEIEARQEAAIVREESDGDYD